MRYSVRQLMWLVTCFSVWFALMALGYKIFGRGGAFTFGLFFGIAILLIFRMTVGWKKSSWMERSKFILTIAAAVAGGAYLAQTYFYHGFDQIEQQRRHVEQLHSTVQTDPRFENIQITFGRPEWVGYVDYTTISGTVATQQDLEVLRELINDNQTTIAWDLNTDWKVIVVPKKEG